MNIDLGLSTILTDEVLSPIFLKLDRNITKRVGGWGAIESIVGGGLKLVGGGGLKLGGADLPNNFRGQRIIFLVHWSSIIHF